ncbi:MAG: cysteine desulfurase family protein [Chloroflexota bacterium]
MARKIYLDHASTTALRPEVLDKMLPLLREEYGNPSSLHSFGRRPHEAIEHARESVAALVGARGEEIYFTSGATEANNWALKGVAGAARIKPAHVITTQIEHYSVLHVAKTLQRQGARVTFLPVDSQGFVDPAAVAAAIDDATVLVSLTHASNEIATIEPIAEVAAVTKAHKVPLHIDATMTAGNLPVDVNALGVDLLTLAAHQFYGPKGVGALFVRKGTRQLPLLEGGLQESGRRAGTENVAGIVGMGRAAELAAGELGERAQRLSSLRDRLRAGLAERIPELTFTGHPTQRLPGHVSFCVSYVEGESLLLLLDARGVSAASGSSCTSRALKASHVLEAIGVDSGLANGSVLMSLGAENDESDVDYVLEVFPPIVERLRAMSPLGHGGM